MKFAQIIYANFLQSKMNKNLMKYDNFSCCSNSDIFINYI